MPRFEATSDLPSHHRVTLAFLAVALGLSGFVWIEPSIANAHSVHDYVGVYGFGMALLLAPVLTRFRSMAAQIFGRAILLQLAAFGTLAGIQNLFVLSRPDHVWTAGLLIATGLVPLAILGLRGLGGRSSRFSPDAFRHTLLASLVFGLADMWALLFYGTMDRFDGVLFACAALMAVALFGLFRLKVWGLIACVGANVAVAGLALSGILDLPDVLAYGLAATAGVQLLLPFPLVRAMLRGARG